MEEERDRPEGMSEEDWQKFLDYTRRYPFGEQDENGVDISLLRSNLKLTPAQRLARLQQTYDFFWRIRNA